MYSKLLWPVYVPSLLLGIAGQMGFILFPLYLLDLGEGPAIAAFVTAGIGIGMVLFDIPAGFLASRFGDKQIMVAAVTASAVSSIAIGFADSPAVLFALAMARGASSSAWLLGLLSYLTDSLESHQRGRAIAVMGGTLRAGALVGPYCGGLIATTYGFRYAFIVAGSLAAIGVLIIMRRSYGQHRPAATDQQAAARFKQVLTSNRKVFATAGFASIGLQLMRAARQLLIPLTGYAIGLDAATIGLIFSISAAIDMALFYPVGVAMDRFGRKTMGVPCMTLFAVGLSILPFATTFGQLLTMSLVVGVANGLGAGIILTLGSDFAPRERRSEFLGVWRFIGSVGNASAPVLIGSLITAATLTAAASVIATIGFCGALVLAFLVEETLRKPDAAPSQSGAGNENDASG